jgi:predicted RND superfamily exporter protein
MEGAVERVRPKMMTVVAIMAGLLPIMWSTGTDSEIMQRIAVPMIGGMISSALLTLIVIPAIFGLVKGFRLPEKALVRRERHSARAVRDSERNSSVDCRRTPAFAMIPATMMSAMPKRLRKTPFGGEIFLLRRTIY